MYDECLHCPMLGQDICESKTYGSEGCKKAQAEYDKQIKDYMKTHCMYCGKRKNVNEDGWDILIDLWNKLELYDNYKSSSKYPRLSKIRIWLIHKFYENNMIDKVKLDPAWQKAWDKRYNNWKKTGKWKM